MNTTKKCHHVTAAAKLQMQYRSSIVYRSAVVIRLKFIDFLHFICLSIRPKCTCLSLLRNVISKTHRPFFFQDSPVSTCQIGSIFFCTTKVWPNLCSVFTNNPRISVQTADTTQRYFEFAEVQTCRQSAFNHFLLLSQ